ncbi:methyltransferase domain-containing protein [Saccharopolyspora phatthalungensis]|uniref:Protein-L-isoaspartate O-methyltransferase n=1 Tax=Saccharopolyspora phatthalungensis TaxID=664693 RepID=A0A840QHJ5_9PSEU|nr:methyltransferase domain-containing protein [Saccharopolyspora phatthalungensis]MBB5156733.1 protein-L-isoaspartate O-methyltransferase [Saccharopolyspora phatthalungensis]
MTTHLDNDWHARAQALADELEARGDLTDPAWKAAVAATPRHELVPEFFQQDQTGGWQPGDMTSPRGMELAYSPVTLVTALADRGHYREAVSSSTKPDLIVRMLEILDVHDDHKVLAIGTGTGYTTALLAHRLGGTRVFSVDIDARLVAAAQARLAAIGLHPTLAAVDGEGGLPDHAPYDRIMATCSVPRVPWSWAEQLRPGGVVLVDVKTAMNAGNLVLLRRCGDRLEGHFTARWGSFMPMRHYNDPSPLRRVPVQQTGSARTTSAAPTPWSDNRVVWLLAQFHGLPSGLQIGHKLDPHTRQAIASTITAQDGSAVEVSLTPVDEETWEVAESGQTALWPAVEAAHQLWLDLGRPDWQRLGLTATRRSQWVWIDDPDGEHRWQIHAKQVH